MAAVSFDDLPDAKPAISFDDLPQAEHGLKFDDLPDAKVDPAAAHQKVMSRGFEDMLAQGQAELKPTPLTPVEESALTMLQQPKAEAASVNPETIRRFLTPLLGPTEAERIEKSIPWGKDAQGNPTYVYKPLGNRLEQEAGLMTPFAKVDPLAAKEGDSALAATGKAAFNTVAGLENSLLSPAGVLLPVAGEVPAIGRIVSGAFAADMATHIPGQLEQMATGKTLQEQIEGGLGAASSTLMALAAGTHAAGGKVLGEAEATAPEAPTAAGESTPAAAPAEAPLPVGDEAARGPSPEDIAADTAWFNRRMETLKFFAEGGETAQFSATLAEGLKGIRDRYSAKDRPAASTQFFEEAGKIAKEHGLDAEQIKTDTRLQLGRMFGADAPEMAKELFGDIKKPSAPLPTTGEAVPSQASSGEGGTAAKQSKPSAVKIKIDVDATEDLRDAFDPKRRTALVFHFPDDAPQILFRGISEQELKALKENPNAEITGGRYSAPVEREHGAQYSLTPEEAMRAAFHDERQKGVLGQKKYIIEVDARGKKASHMDPRATTNPELAAKGIYEIPADRISGNLGVSVKVPFKDVISIREIEREGKGYKYAEPFVKPSAETRSQNPELAREQAPAPAGEAPTVNGVYPEPKQTVAAPHIIPSPQALGVTHPLPPFLNSIVDAMLGVKIGDNVRGLVNRLKGFVGTVSGETFPNTTIADRTSGELGARWISSRIAAPFVADNFSKQVLEGTDIDPVKFGTALTEDNLRSVRQGYIDAGKPEEASRVGTAIGGKNSPFKTEADYQNFLNDPAVKTAIERHISLWGEVVDPMYKKAMSLDPDEALPSRGAQTGARINLHGIDPDAPVTNRKPVSTVAQGNPLGTLRKKSPFGRQATGTGTYNTNYEDMMANTFGRQLEIANKNAFEKQLVESGNAVIGKTGEKVVLPDGEETVPFPLKRQTLMMKGEGGTTVVPQNQSIYVRKSIAPEYRRGSNIDLIPVPGAIKTLGGVLNRAALAGLTDATVHVTNLAHVIFNRPGVTARPIIDSLLSAFGRSDIPVILTKAVVKGFQDNTAQLAKLAEIGALRAPHDAPANFNPLAKIGDVIQWADKTTRLVMDDAFTRLAKEGLVEDTETNRREFINQVGQYNKRAQGDLMRLARDTGIGPFATAGRNFNVLGVKTMALAPGAKATGLQAAAVLRANVLSKWVGGVVLIGTLNYLLTKDKGGGVAGRPGVKIGHIDTGMSDQNGRPLSINAIDLLGLGRGLRATGVRGFVEAKRNKLTTSDAMDSASRDIYNTAISPFVGPVPKFVLGVGNKTPAIGVGNPHPIAAPGESQIASNVVHSLIEANPVVASIADARKPGAGVADTVRRQLPRFTLQPSNPPEMMKDYPEIVRKAQASAFIDDVIGRARKLEPDARKKFLADSLARLKNADDKEHAIQRFKQRKVWVP